VVEYWQFLSFIMNDFVEKKGLEASVGSTGRMEKLRKYFVVACLGFCALALMSITLALAAENVVGGVSVTDEALESSIESPNTFSILADGRRRCKIVLAHCNNLAEVSTFSGVDTYGLDTLVVDKYGRAELNVVGGVTSTCMGISAVEEPLMACLCETVIRWTTNMSLIECVYVEVYF